MIDLQSSDAAAGDAIRLSAAALGAAFAAAGLGSAAARGDQGPTALGAILTLLGTAALAIATAGSAEDPQTRYAIVALWLAGAAFLISPYTAQLTQRVGFAVVVTAPAALFFMAGAYLSWLFDPMPASLRYPQVEFSALRPSGAQALVAAALPIAPAALDMLFGAFGSRRRALAALTPVAVVVAMTQTAPPTFAAAIGAGGAWAFGVSRSRLALAGVTLGVFIAVARGVLT
ncbi:MAG: hypothetical protein AAFX08_02960 [Pseudomonadota bacterium]